MPDGNAPGLENFARQQNGTSITIKLDFHSRRFRDEVAEHLLAAELGSTFMFVASCKNTIDFNIDGNLSQVLNDVSKVLKASGSDVYIEPVGGSERIQKVVEEDVMAAFSLWLSGRMSGQIAPDAL
jgi:hypothetical protein